MAGKRKTVESSPGFDPTLMLVYRAKTCAASTIFSVCLLDLLILLPFCHNKYQYRKNSFLRIKKYRATVF